MTEKQRAEFDKLWSLATTTKKGWRFSDNPCVRNDKAEVEKAWIKAKTWVIKQPDDAYKDLVKNGKLDADAFIDLIDREVRAQARMRCEERAAGAEPPQPVGLSVFLNKRRWENTLGSHMEAKDGEWQKDKAVCKCGKPTEIKTLCLDCYFDKTKHLDYRRPRLKEYFYKNLHDENETLNQTTDRLKSLGRHQLSKIKTILRRI